MKEKSMPVDASVLRTSLALAAITAAAVASLVLTTITGATPVFA